MVKIPVYNPDTGNPIYCSDTTNPAYHDRAATGTPCSNCNSGTTNAAYQAGLDNLFTAPGFACGCPSLKGGVLRLDQDPLDPCHFSGLIGGVGCQFQGDLWLESHCGYDRFFLLSDDSGIFEYSWGDNVAGPWDCDTITLPYVGLCSGVGVGVDCAGNLSNANGEGHGAITLIGLG